jgi:hypothetical protein
VDGERTLSTMRDVEVGAPTPSIDLADELLEE